eukprot:gene17621-23198_t
MSATELMDPKMDNSYGISNKSLDELKLLKPDFPHIMMEHRFMRVHINVFSFGMIHGII